MELLPPAFLFRFALPIPHVAELPRAKGWPVGDAMPTVPLFSQLNQSDLDRSGEDVALRVAWNEAGIGIAVEVHGKKKPPSARSGDLRGDGLLVWIDTRDARAAHRASRYCHEFAIVPHAGTSRTFRPRIVKRDIAMAREASAPMGGTPPIKSESLEDGYRLEAWLPSEELYGFDPDQAPRIGFHAILTDGELGERALTVGTEFATDRDPSLWTTLELSREAAPSTKKTKARRATSRKPKP